MAARPLPWYVDVGPIRRWRREMEDLGRSDEAERRIDGWVEMTRQADVVRSTVEGRVGRITLSFPAKGNALVPPMYVMLARAIAEMAEDDAVWALLIDGEGRSFSTGGYVGRDGFFAGIDAAGATPRAEPIRRTATEMFLLIQQALAAFEKPVVTMLNGPVMAESVDFALMADLRTGHPGSDMWFSFGYTGNTAYTGSAWLLPRMVGLSKASELLLTAARISGSEAHGLGLINQLWAAEELASRTGELLERITSLPPVTLRLIKKEIRTLQEVGSYRTSIEFTSMIEPIVQFSADHVEAEEATVEKRPPVVRGY